MARRVAIVVLIAVLFWPVSAAAQESIDTKNDDVLIRVHGPITVGPNDTLDSVFGVSNDVTVDGTVRDTLWVVDGTATVNGRVDGDLVVIRGTLNLGPTAVVKDVTLVRSDFNRDPAATVTGDVHERSKLIDVSFGWGSFVFSFLFWLSTTIVVLVAGILFALLGPRPLVGGAATLTGRFGGSLVTALVIWIGLPILGIAAIFTLIGIPLGIAILLFALPVLWFLGYLVAGTRLGLAIVRSADPVAQRARLVGGVVLGLVIFQLIALIPFVGPLVAGLAGFLGAGALIYLAYRSQGFVRSEPVVPTAGPEPAA
jgi:hypothetical protein